MSGKLLASAVIASLGGLLFGFDTVVISGAEQSIQALWGLSDWAHGMAMSAALWGTVLGALGGALPTDRLGRKGTLLWIGLLYLVSAVWSALANEVASFWVARFLGGVGVGISTVVAPLYISEIAPAKHRGWLAGLFQFNIVLGILIAFVSNSVLRGLENDWRWMLGAEGFPAAAYTLFALFIPESPRWLIGLRRRREEGRAVLAQLNPGADPDAVEEMVDEIAEAAAAEERATGGAAFSSGLRVPILLAFLIAFFNQLSGINAVLYFAPRIFQMTGLGENAAFAQSIGIGLINLVFTIVGLYLIDRLGRKTLLVIGSIGYITSLALVAATFFASAGPFAVAGDALAVKSASTAVEEATAQGEGPERLEALRAKAAEARERLAASTRRGDYDGEGVEFADGATNESAIAIAEAALAESVELAGSGGMLVLIGILAFISSHAIGQGAVIWVFISEIFPNEHRAIGNSIGCGTHWVFAALITLLFPTAIGAFAPGYVFAFFCFMMILQLAWVLTMVIETKGVPLEEVQKKLGIA